MNSSLPPILLTSSVIAMDQSVALKDPDQRANYTLDSIGQWLKVSPDIRLVICDGSGYDFSGIVKKRYPGSSVECLFFENDKQLVERHGKGYGEGEIIKYALLHSPALNDAKWFAKCTGKLWVSNFLGCLKEWNDFFLCKAYFSHVFSFKSPKFEYVDTRFYLTDKDVYLKYFSEAHLEVGGMNGTSIEDKFKEMVLRNKFTHVVFRVPPVIQGMGGGAGMYYRNNLIRRFKEKLRSRIVQSNPSFKNLFNRTG